MKKKYYCRHCGSLMQETGTGAENYYFECEAGRVYTKNAYNEKTGKRQCVYRYVCPRKPSQWWRKLFSRHDDFMNEDVYEEVEFGKWEKVTH